MNPILRNILAILAGLIIGSVVNMGVLILGGSIIPPPEGVDVTNMESLATSIHLFGPINFVFPFLAHAIGTLVGAFLATIIAANHKMKFALAIGALFLIGGIINAFMIPAPSWFIVADLLVAYIPMAWIAAKIAGGMTKK
jgi:hypothetical protein